MVSHWFDQAEEDVSHVQALKQAVVQLLRLFINADF